MEWLLVGGDEVAGRTGHLDTPESTLVGQRHQGRESALVSRLPPAQCQVPGRRHVQEGRKCPL